MITVTENTRKAYSEVDQILELIDEEQKNEIPKKLREFFKEEKDKTYEKKIDKNIPIKEQNLKKETLAIIALLNLEYWCKDENEKNRLKAIYAKNEKEYQEKLKEKFNPDVFNNNANKSEKTEKIENVENIENNNTQLVEYKESVLKKIINKIKSILHISKD